MGDLLTGLFFGAWQVGMTALVGALKAHLAPEASFEWEPLYLSAIWGGVIGTYSRTYRNWVYRGTKPEQTLKNVATSFSFAYPLIMLTEGGLESVNPLVWAGLATNLHIWANTFANNLAKTEWLQIPKLRAEERVAAGDIEVPLPGGRRVDTGMSRASFEYQATYVLGPYTLKMADLTGVEAAGVPIGKLSLWASIPIMNYLTLRYAEWKGLDAAPALRSAWESRKRRLADLARSGGRVISVSFRVARDAAAAFARAAIHPLEGARAVARAGARVPRALASGAASVRASCERLLLRRGRVRVPARGDPAKMPEAA